MNSLYTLEQQRNARRAAEYRYKNLNAATTRKLDLYACMMLTIVLLAGTMAAMGFNDDGAKPGKILIKSELSKADLKVLQLAPEQRHVR